MNQTWQMLGEKFGALSEREKWLISGCGLVAIVMLLFTLVLEPSVIKHGDLKQQLQSQSQQNQKTEADILLATAKLKRDPDQDIDIELEKLSKQSLQQAAELEQILGTLITPSQMAIMLEGVLAGTSGLELVSLESQTAELISGTQEASNYNGYFIHPVRLELTGDYFSILKYLETLESLPVNYYWRSFQYSVEEYPKARLALEVYTLGTRQEFIGG